MISLAMASLLSVASVAPGSGEHLCVLTAADFQRAGVSVGKLHANVDDDGNSAYCIYRGISGAKGGVELDVFYPAGASTADIGGTWKTMLASDPGAKYQPEGLPGVDDSLYSLSIPQPGFPKFAANAVRRGKLIFTISMPSTSRTKAVLEKLSALVLQRLSR